MCLQAQIPTPQSTVDTPTFPSSQKLASHHQQQRRTSLTKRNSNESRQPAQASKLRRVQSAVNPSDLKGQCTSSRTSQSDYKLKSAACSANQSDYSCTSYEEESDFCQVKFLKNYGKSIDNSFYLQRSLLQ